MTESHSDFYVYNKWSLEEYQRVFGMLTKCGTFDVQLCMNDTFGFACAESTDCDYQDLLIVTELFEKYGWSGVVAWAAYKEEADWIKPTPEYFKALEEIKANPEKFYYYHEINKGLRKKEKER